MTPTRQGSIRLFRFAGIDVYLHWLWFLAAYYLIKVYAPAYTSLLWPVLECLALFGIVLLHEFGHALACRQVGGQANLIVLWPLGGVAYVAPPQRPGATLWSLAAGPLVNVALLPLLGAAWLLVWSAGGAQVMPDAYHFIQTVFLINTVLLVFNLLPVYPLDGGQILQSLLWFIFGRARSLMIVTVIGFAGVAVLLGLALLARSLWFGILSVFILIQCWNGLLRARALAKVDQLPRRAGLACPSCRQAPIIGPIWRCENCRQPFDPFAAPAVCPHCGTRASACRCPECGVLQPLANWVVAPPPLAPAGY